MEQLKVKTKNINRLFYSPETLAGKLERYLVDNDLSAGFGNYELGLKNRTMENGEERYAGLDMNDDFRGIRSLCVKAMEQKELERIHTFEIKFINRFISVAEMERIIKRPFNLHYLINDKKIRYTWNENLKNYMIEYNNRHRPQCFKFHDIVVPPYHLYDLEFDGMTYHHSWDKTVFYGENIEFKEEKKGKSVGHLME